MPTTGQNWSVDPFEGVIKDGFVWGRGALDDKHALIGIVEAIEFLLKQGLRPARSVFVAFGHDEEATGIAGAQLIVKHLQVSAWATRVGMHSGWACADVGCLGNSFREKDSCSRKRETRLSCSCSVRFTILFHGLACHCCVHINCTAGYLSFEPTAQCVAHALKGLACRAHSG